MTSILIVADDVTGANATAAQFAHRGVRTLSALGVGDHRPEAKFDAVAVCTSSRHISADSARARVGDVIEAFGDVSLVVKRIDTTLRGNVGAELEGALYALRARTPSTVRALIVAAWPRAGRVTRDGILMVDGLPLHESVAAQDETGPRASGRIIDIVGSQTRMRFSEVGLDAVDTGGQALRAALAQQSDALVCDALSEAHLQAIAAAASDVSRERNLTWLPVDPGPFGVELADALGLLPRQPSRGPLLIVAGSMTGTTREQLVEVEKIMGTRFIDVDVSRLDPTELGGRIERLLEDAPPDGLIGVRTANTTPAGEAASPEVARLLGQAVRLALDAAVARGIYVTGGDVTAALLDALDADGIEILSEALPLAAAGVLRGGPHAGLAIVTKGGLVGGPGDAVACLDHLLSMTRPQPGYWRRA